MIVKVPTNENIGFFGLTDELCQDLIGSQMLVRNTAEVYCHQVVLQMFLVNQFSHECSNAYHYSNIQKRSFEKTYKDSHQGHNCENVHHLKGSSAVFNVTVLYRTI